MSMAQARIPVENVRARTTRPVTSTQLEIIKLLAEGLSHRAIADARRCSICTVRNHINEAAVRVPGHGSPSMRLALWYRGATAELLGGV